MTCDDIMAEQAWKHADIARALSLSAKHSQHKSSFGAGGEKLSKFDPYSKQRICVHLMYWRSHTLIILFFFYFEF